MRMRRVIPYPGRVLVELGQRVEPQTLIAETILQPAEPIHLTVTEMFGYPPSEILGLMQVQQGDKVTAGQTIAVAEYQGELYELKAPGSGLIEQISPLLGTVSIRLEGDPHAEAVTVDTGKELDIPSIIAAQRIQVSVGQLVRIGQTLATDPDEEEIAYAPIQGEIIAIDGAKVTIKRPFVRTQVLAFLAGEVVEIVPEFGAVIESDMLCLQGIFGLGDECFGTLRLLVDAPNAVAAAETIGESDKGQILFAGALASEELLRRCKEHGVAGVIAGGVHNYDLVQILEAEITPGMDTRHSLGLTLLASEGMGELAVDERLFAHLREAEGRVVSLNGLTQIRAGAIRPCIYLPAALAADAVARADENDSPAEAREAGAGRGLQIGSRVRLIREPWFGRLATVAELKGLERMPSGIRALSCVVELDDGTRLTVARSNLEPLPA